MKKFKIILIILFVVVSFGIIQSNTHTVKADELSDNIEEQLGNIDLSEIDKLLGDLNVNNAEESFTNYVYKLLKGEYQIGFTSVLENIGKSLVSNFTKLIPMLFTIVAIAIFCGITQSFKSSFLSDGVADVIFFVCLSSIALLLSTELISIFTNAKNTIENIAKISEIMSPIILTLMLVSGGNSSVTLYKPAVVFLSGGVINIILTIIFPLIIVMTIFSMIGNFSSSTKLNKFVDTASSTIKWILGLTITIFTLFITVQGIASACHDGISIRAAKYAISNSIPIIGGFIKDGFDLVVAGSVLIKNALGVASVLSLFFYVLSPILYIAVFSLMLKIIASIIEPIADVRISNFCMSISKCLSYVSMAIILVSFMFFIMILIMIFSANAFL